MSMYVSVLSTVAERRSTSAVPKVRREDAQHGVGMFHHGAEGGQTD